MPFSPLLFIEHNDMMDFDNRPILIWNDCAYRIWETSLENPPSWSILMLDEIRRIWSKFTFF